MICKAFQCTESVKYTAKSSKPNKFYCKMTQYKNNKNVPILKECSLRFPLHQISNSNFEHWRIQIN